MLTYFISYNKSTFQKFLAEKLDTLQLKYYINSNNELIIHQNLSEKEENKFRELLKNYDININSESNITLAERIKRTIDQLVESNKIRNCNTSDYISEKLNYSYTHLSKIFTEETHSSIENYLILKKIEKAKQLLLNTNNTLTEIAFQLNYSSVSHLSRQFKKMTGLTPSSFINIVKKRKETN